MREYEREQATSNNNKKNASRMRNGVNKKNLCIFNTEKGVRAC